MPEPWEQQPGEGPKPWSAFTLYRDMGPDRSITKVARQYGKSRSLIERWSAKWRWVGRCRAWDAEQDRLRRAAQTTEIEAMAKRQVHLGMLLQARAAKRFQDMSEAEVAGLTMYEASHLLQIGVRLEALGRGTAPLEPPAVPVEPTDEQPVIAILRRHPERIGRVTSLLAELQEIVPELASSPIREGGPGFEDKR